LKTAKQIRRIGRAQVAIGLFLASLTGIVTVQLSPFLMHPEHGEAVQRMFVFGLLGALIVLGVNSMISGVSQIKTGRRNKWTLISMGVVLVLLIVCAVGIFASLQ
jgi:MFS family permease